MSSSESILHFTPERLRIIEEAVKERLDEYGALHSLMCGQLAFDMATIYGEDSLKAYVAGILHDWNRLEDAKQLMQTAELLGIEIDETIEANPKLLHSQTGAYKAREHFLYHIEDGFDIGQDVYNAIARHTVGVPNMTPLDMIIYVADMTEPTRNFKRVDDLREMIGTLDLENLFIQAYSHTISFLANKQKLMHPNTLEVWNSYVLKSEEQCE